MVSDRLIHVLQRDPAEEALKSNNMNLDQAMSKFTNTFVESMCPCVSIASADMRFFYSVWQYKYTVDLLFEGLQSAFNSFAAFPHF